MPSTPQPRLFARLASSQAVGGLMLLGACQAEDPSQRCATDPALREAIETELRRELRPLVEAELRRDLRAGVAADVRAESPRASGSQTAPAQPPPEVDLVRPASASELGTRLARLSGPLRVHELSVGTGILDRAPHDVRDHYPEAPELLYCFSSVESRTAQTLTHVWRRDGVLVSRVELEIPRSVRWKTWSRQKVLPKWTGTWSCEVVSPEGTQLGVTTFTVGPVPAKTR